MPDVTVIGAGVAGLACAVELLTRGVRVRVLEKGEALGAQSSSWFAGGMLAPWCERATTERDVGVLGARGIAWWMQHVPSTVQRGSLVVASPRDIGELKSFARKTEQFEWVDGAQISALEPDLQGRFEQGLFFPSEAHLDARQALFGLQQRIRELGGTIEFGVDADSLPSTGLIVDCRGLHAQAELPELRAVRGEMAILRSHDVAISRPVRLLHPRMPLYVVPRFSSGAEQGTARDFTVGATMIESDARGPASVRSLLDLLGAAFALCPAFGEAEVLEVGVGLRPAFSNNLPRVTRHGRVVHVNGLYRHGFLLTPELAAQTAALVLEG